VHSDGKFNLKPVSTNMSAAIDLLWGDFRASFDVQGSSW
jgi:hypothetical protein